MKFWDSSAIVPLVIAEKTSAWCHSLAKTDPQMIVWFLTPTEILSALSRLERSKNIQRQELLESKSRLKLWRQVWTEIIHFEAVRERAERLLEVHPLRAADALQLAAALIAFREKPQGNSFVCLDSRLATAADKEGFEVLYS
jgi:predicted nucleic acid-binding protein